MDYPLRNPQVQFLEMGNEWLLYSPDQKAVHVLNRTARLIWDLCDGQHPLDQIVQSVREQFSVPQQVDLARDVRQTVDQFASKQLVTAAEGVIEGVNSPAP